MLLDHSDVPGIVDRRRWQKHHTGPLLARQANHLGIENERLNRIAGASDLTPTDGNDLGLLSRSHSLVREPSGSTRRSKVETTVDSPPTAVNAREDRYRRGAATDRERRLKF